MDLRKTLLLRAISLLKTPTVFFLGVVVEKVSETGVWIRIPLTYRSKNPVGSMFFGALTTGADVAGSLAAYLAVRELGSPRVSILFKDMHASFLKKATADVIFQCEDGAAIRAAVQQTVQTKQKAEVPVSVVAYLRGGTAAEPVATFKLTLSMKAMA